MGNIEPQVVFAFQSAITLRDRNRLRLFLAKLCRKEGHRLESLSVVFCSDEFLLGINRQYLQHDDYTDIISFDYNEPGASSLVNGELYISADRIRDNAKQFAVTVNMELHRVLFHGVLHLCGYEDKDPADQGLMRKKEAASLMAYFG
jgi:probable rRNA maturation factor